MTFSKRAKIQNQASIEKLTKEQDEACLKELNVVLGKYGRGLSAKLDYTEAGIVPVIKMGLVDPKDEKKDE